MDERWHDPSREAIRALLEEMARGLEPEARVLDAGAGECQYAPIFQGAQYYACDFARGEPEWDYTKLSVISDLGSLPFASGVFSLTICISTLEHLSEPPLALRELARTLASDGRLVVAVPFQGYREHQAPYDFYRYTQYGLRNLAEGAGLEVEEIRPVGGVFSLMAKLIHYLTGYWFLQPEPGWKRVLKKPLRFAYSVFKRSSFLLLRYLDKRDKRRDYALQYFLICSKRN